MIVAIDGSAAVGTGTLARGLAARFNLAHLDSGLLYRAVAARLLASGSDGSDPGVAQEAAAAVTREDLARSDLRGEAVARMASLAAVHPGVRRALLDCQRQFARCPPGDAAGAVLDGRDIGTVVLPDADVKFFLTGSLEVRLTRRVKELRARGEAFIQARVEQDMRERDQRDRSRAIAPLAAASDAHVIDTTQLDADAVLEAACRLMRPSPTASAKVVQRPSVEPSDSATKVRSQESP